MICPSLPEFRLDDWGLIQALFKEKPKWLFQQAWNQQLEPGFRPGVFQAGCWKNALVMYAELSDDDIFNPVAKFNEPAFTAGDAFEMFMRPAGQDAYYELHVSPRNQILQLRFSSEERDRLRKGGEKFPALDVFKVSRPLFESRTLVSPAESKWRVAAMIPFASIVEKPLLTPSSPWLFSASRYDHTRGQSEPVLSSTSPHQVRDFHRRQEWGRIEFPS